MSSVAVIDNYDSFTYNIVQYLRELGAGVDVYRNDAVSIEQLEAAKPAALLISPGPGNPDGAGISLAALAHFSTRMPVFGVCLGHQTIGQHFGGSIVHAKQIMHGKLSEVYHNGQGVFAGLPSPLTATRYHSLVIQTESVPEQIQVTAWTQSSDGQREEIMGVRHKTLEVEGVQFHPESIKSQHGHALLRNFLQHAGIAT